MFIRGLKWLFKEVLLTWYALAWLGLFALIVFVWNDKVKLGNIKAGTFEITFENNAKQLNVFNTPEFQNVKKLNEQQLKFFLVMGGEDAQFYQFRDVALTDSAKFRLYEKLKQYSLLNFTRRDKDTTVFYFTETGQKIHLALIRSIYKQFID
jgi:hypothetical protein